MTAHLIQHAGVSGAGRLLDLACGTGQLAFPLRRWFSEVWAVDREGAAFDADLAAALGPFAEDGAFSETVSFACDLARKPGAQAP